METLLKDIRYAARVLLQKPGFTAIAVLALALGIGANTAIFSVVNGVLLRPLPYRNPDRLVHVHRMQLPIERGPISRPDFFEWRDKQEVFSDIGAYHFQILNLTGKEQAERLVAARVTGNFFSLFDIPPASGRFFGPSDDQPGSSRVAVIGFALWQRRFGGDPGLIGQTIIMNGDAYTVVGVAPASFRFPRRIEVWTPAILAEQKTTRGSNYLKIIARLKDGVAESQAEAQMNQISAALAQQYPDNDTNLTVKVVPLLEEQVRNVADPARRRRVCSADRVRQRRQSFAGARVIPNKRVRCSHCARRESGAHRQTTAHRKLDPRIDRGRARSPAIDPWSRHAGKARAGKSPASHRGQH